MWEGLEELFRGLIHYRIFFFIMMDLYIYTSIYFIQIFICSCEAALMDMISYDIICYYGYDIKSYDIKSNHIITKDLNDHIVSGD